VRAGLGDLADRLRSVAKRFGFRLHVGIGAANVEEGLPSRYQAALAAAEQGTARDVAVTYAAPTRPAPTNPLRELRAEVVRVVRDDPKLLRPAFDRYLEVLTAHCGYRLEPIRAHLEAAFDTIGEAARSAGALEERSLLDFEHALGRAAREASTVSELVSEQRKAIADLSSSLLRPREGRRDRGLQRALAFIGDHIAEPLPLHRVARVAGFEPTYFSHLFATAEGVTFRAYVRGARIDRARQLLGYTALSVDRVARLSGFPSRNPFYTAFKRALGETPAQYRRRPK
jgi:AraC-like DNA-binding protein